MAQRPAVLAVVVALIAVVPLAGACRRDGGAPADRTQVYVSDEDAGTIAVIDPAAGRVVATIPVGKRPRGLRLTADGETLLVALSGSPKAPPGTDEATLPPADRSADGIGVVDLASGRLVRTLASGRDPEAFDLVHDGTLLVVSNEETAEASIVDLASGEVRARVAVGGEPEGVTTHPDDRLVYVTSEEEHRVDVVDPIAARVVASIPTGARPRAIAFTPDGARAFVSNELDASVTVIDGRTHRAIGRVAIPDAGGGETGPRPMGVAVSRDGKRAYVSTGRGGSVAVIDTATLAVERVVPGVGARPWGVALDRDGRLFSANGPGGDVSVIDVAKGALLARIPAGRSPWGVVVSR